MTTLREGLRAPVIAPPAELVEELVSFLDGQSRIRLVAWMSHDHVGGVDQHLLFGIDERDWRESDLRALEEGLEHDAVGFHAWLDIFSVADADAVRAHGLVLWEQTSPGPDPLAYRLTYEPLEAESAAVEQLRARLSAVPAIRCVGGTLKQLWKGDALVEESVELSVDAPPQANVLQVAADAARETIVAGRGDWSSALGRPSDDAAILYEATA